MEYINPLFTNTAITRKQPISASKSTNKPSKKIRAPRKDKTHNIKFPITEIEQMKLRSYCRQVKRIYQAQGKEEIKQTKFNTLLLRFGLDHPAILSWNHPYKDTNVFMHTNILESEYDMEIGGPHGLAIQKNLSDRKIVHHIVISVLGWLEGEGNIETIL